MYSSAGVVVKSLLHKILLLGLVIYMLPASSQEIFIHSVGIETCGVILAKVPTKKYEAITTAWLQGYLSGRNHSTATIVGSRFSEEELLNLWKSRCSLPANKKMTFYQISEGIYSDLKKNKY